MKLAHPSTAGAGTGYCPQGYGLFGKGLWTVLMPVIRAVSRPERRAVLRQKFRPDAMTILHMKPGLLPCLLLGLLLTAPWGQTLGQGKGKKAPRARPVVVAEVKAVTELPTFKASGLLAPISKALLSVEVSGRVAEIYLREGDHVRQGQVLARLGNADLKLNRMVLAARVKEAEAEVALNRQKLRRTEALHKRNLASAEQFENETASIAVTVARHASAVAQLARVESQLDMLVVRAPISGQIINSDLEIGQWINTTKPIYEIYNFNQFELFVGVPSRFFNKITRATPVTLHVAEIDKVLKGKIRAAVRHVDSASGNFMLRIEVDNPDQTSLSGLLANIEVPVGSAGSVLTVPRDAIVRRGGKTQVVVVRDGKAHIVSVRVKGNINQSDVIVRGGLKAREMVVVRGNERLRPGMPVVVAGKL